MNKTILRSSLVTCSYMFLCFRLLFIQCAVVSLLLLLPELGPVVEVVEAEEAEEKWV